MNTKRSPLYHLIGHYKKPGASARWDDVQKAGGPRKELIMKAGGGAQGPPLITVKDMVSGFLDI